MRIWAAFSTVLLSVVLATPAAAQSRTTPRSSGNRPAENVVDGIRRSVERRPPEWRQQAQPCMHYLDEAEAFHHRGEAYFVQASRARNSPEQSRLVRLGNDAIRERQRLIGEFWACTRRTTAGDEFHSSDPPRRDPKPPVDPGPPVDPEPPDVSPPPREVPPRQPPIWQLPPGFPFPPAEARPPQTRNPRTPQPDPRIVVLGDSMTAGTGLQANEAWPKVLEAKLRADNYRYHVLNAGKHGDTAQGARQRAAQALIGGTQILIIAIGINDGQNHRPPAQIKNDIAAIITMAKAKGIRVALCAYEILTFDESSRYDTAFDRIYPELAREHGVLLIPADWALQIWDDASLRLPRDHVHPNAAGARAIADYVYPAIQPLLGPRSSAPPTSRRSGPRR